MRYDFPGNVRELENIIEHAFILCRGNMVQMEHLPRELLSQESAGQTGKPSLVGSPLVDAEAKTILEALRRHNGHRSKTASYLGIDKATLWRKMKKYDLIYPTADKENQK
jgi:transcriptional regulator with PAS, ATPase and Fis domain